MVQAPKTRWGSRSLQLNLSSETLEETVDRKGHPGSGIRKTFLDAPPGPPGTLFRQGSWDVDPLQSGRSSIEKTRRQYQMAAIAAHPHTIYFYEPSPLIGLSDFWEPGYAKDKESGVEASDGHFNPGKGQAGGLAGYQCYTPAPEFSELTDVKDLKRKAIVRK
ncbi:hypothetical protein FALBO_8258 [Fusarium albosuccineum]|uniref:Uncharacterized protein n=1 Tax=Fusarium albosuccineum TaxID=1237068 RepID=A0A8H4LB55_9HYPO|nr:hypothetical protein FALBO_8258 [Fusarium albosuccineum]